MCVWGDLGLSSILEQVHQWEFSVGGRDFDFHQNCGVFLVPYCKNVSHSVLCYIPDKDKSYSSQAGLKVYVVLFPPPSSFMIQIYKKTANV